jgi:polyisoprenyl-phosphate glycosyltransferase
MDGLDNTSELILINDGSRDRTLELLRKLPNRDDRVVDLSLARAEV